jgi:GT2 family glycosyltransferase
MVLLVDNKSSDDSARILTDYFHRHFPAAPVMDGAVSPDFGYENQGFALYLNHENRGFAAGNNVLLQYIRHWDCFLWLLNPDVVVASDAMGSLVSEMEEGQKLVLGNSVYSMREPDKLLHYGGFQINWNLGTVKPVLQKNGAPDYIYGASLFTRASAFLEIGLIPEFYFLYWEESHWCMMARSGGYAFRLLPHVHIFDKVGGSVGRGFRAYYYYTRNGLVFFSQFRPSALWLVFGLNFLRALKKALFLNFAAAKGVWKGNLDYLSYARQNKD